MSTLLSCPYAKYPIHCPSGDQNGCDASSVPCTTDALSSPISYLQITYLLPWSQYATIATVFPSGDNATSFATARKVLEKCLVCGACRASDHHATPPTPSSNNNPPETSQPARDILVLATTDSAAGSVCDSAIHFSWLAKSLALCQRSSGSFARHFLTSWSSTGGVIGFVALIGSGSFSKIADATFSWLLP